MLKELQGTRTSYNQSIAIHAVWGQSVTIPGGTTEAERTNVTTNHNDLGDFCHESQSVKVRRKNPGSVTQQPH